MFIYLNKKKEKLSKWLKKTTTIDFSDWGVFILFIIGLLGIIYFRRNISLSNTISIIVLWFTAIAVMQYTKETYWLKQIEQKNLKLQKAPFVIMHFENDNCFILKNVGRGIARNVIWKIAGKSDICCPQKTVISPNGLYTRICSNEYYEF